MNATITKIDPPRMGKAGKMYRLVCFKFPAGGSAVSFISPDMRNYKQWLAVLEVGNEVGELKMKGNNVDADSVPKLLSKPEKQEELF